MVFNDSWRCLRLLWAYNLGIASVYKRLSSFIFVQVIRLWNIWCLIYFILCRKKIKNLWSFYELVDIVWRHGHGQCLSSILMSQAISWFINRLKEHFAFEACYERCDFYDRKAFYIVARWHFGDRTKCLWKLRFYIFVKGKKLFPTGWLNQ